MTLGPARRAVDRDWFGLGRFLPGPRFTREGACIYLLDEVGSTNAFLRGRGEPAQGRLCRWDGWGWRAEERCELRPPANAAPGTVVAARRQTAGRGRQGRCWTDCGGLNLSVTVPPHRAVPGRGFSVWLGLIAVLVLREDFRIDARLKWPNDIVVGWRKLGGILLERSGRGGTELVVGGMGLNLSTGPGDFPAELQDAATSVLVESGHTIVPGELAGKIIARIESELDGFEAGGWAPFRPSLALLDCLLGQQVRLASRDRRIVGRAVGIDDGGRLLVQTEDETGREQVHVYHAGDVHLLPTGFDVDSGEV